MSYMGIALNPGRVASVHVRPCVADAHTFHRAKVERRSSLLKPLGIEVAVESFCWSKMECIEAAVKIFFAGKIWIV